MDPIVRTGQCLRISCCWPAITACALGACGGGSQSAADSSPAATAATATRNLGPPVPAPVSPANRIEGDVVGVHGESVAYAVVDPFVEVGNFGYSFWYANGPLYADAAGHFVITPLPESKVKLRTGRDGYRQPCALILNAQGDVRVRVELIPVASLDSFNPPRPQLGVETVVTGNISEYSTAAGYRPVTGVEIWVDDGQGLDLWLARTRSDLAGDFFLCNLPREAVLQFRKDGYQPHDVAINGSAVPMQVEMRRQS